jgi:peptidoglycan DL-endopeptidase CwlO
LGQAVSPGGIRAGDLIFSNFGEGGVAGPGHVQLAISPTHVVEAPHTGASVQVSPVPSGHVVVRRILS